MNEFEKEFIFLLSEISTTLKDLAKNSQAILTRWNTNGMPQERPIAAATNATCPECGKALVLRTAKKGPNAGRQFYGCSGYAHGCRFTCEVNELKNIENDHKQYEKMRQAMDPPARLDDVPMPTDDDIPF